MEIHVPAMNRSDAVLAGIGQPAPGGAWVGGFLWAGSLTLQCAERGAPRFPFPLRGGNG